MFKIVRTDAEQEVCFKALEEVARVVHLPEFGTSEDDLVQECKDADLILHCYTPITRRVIENAQRLKGIIKYGVGIDAIDIDAAKQRGIPVANIPDYGDQTVAEGAFYLMITLAKKWTTGTEIDEARWLGLAQKGGSRFGSWRENGWACWLW
mmetsp:Transcript_12821/g.23109  ORF Transcript_12821/g.23109 Transcript_12821/m.23109 type:complete len:152 (-) Transcript_12821:762-1217(-)